MAELGYSAAFKLLPLGRAKVRGSESADATLALPLRTLLDPSGSLVLIQCLEVDVINIACQELARITYSVSCYAPLVISATLHCVDTPESHG